MSNRELIEELGQHLDIGKNHEAGLIPVATQVLIKQAAAALEAMEWKPIGEMTEEIKNGGQILGWCNSKADPYHLDDGRLTTYGAHAEVFGYCADGPQLVEWGGEYSGTEDETGQDYSIPNWWFKAETNFEQVANPTHFIPLPPAPEGE